jgi:hypothetical protein
MGHRNEALVEAMSSDEKLGLIEEALDECEDLIMECVNAAICREISKLETW